MNETKLKIGDKEIVLIIGALAVIFFFYLFGITGIRVIIAALVLALPFYLILNNFKFELSEKIIFSIYASIGIFPSIAYYLGLALGNLALAAGATFLLLMCVAFAVEKFKRKEGQQQE